MKWLNSLIGAVGSCFRASKQCAEGGNTACITASTSTILSMCCACEASTCVFWIVGTCLCVTTGTPSRRTASEEFPRCWGSWNLPQHHHRQIKHLACVQNQRNLNVFGYMIDVPWMTSFFLQAVFLMILGFTSTVMTAGAAGAARGVRALQGVSQLSRKRPTRHGRVLRPPPGGSNHHRT